MTATLLYVRLDAADLWHLASSLGLVPALCGHPPTAKGWPHVAADPPARLLCQWCARAERKAALKGSP